MAGSVNEILRQRQNEFFVLETDFRSTVNYVATAVPGTAMARIRFIDFG
jgi:hypothetical protein